MTLLNQIADLIEAIDPCDSLEKQHQEESARWVCSGVGIFRIQKPDIPNKHLVSYFCLCDLERKKVLLVEHRKAGLWLPSGGHVEPNEHPTLTAQRECLEELGIHADFWRKEPIFITAAVTVGTTAGHTDVSLWYVLRGDSSVPLQFDQEEFKSVQWFDYKDIPYTKSDPHMKRFLEKFQAMLQ